MADIIPFLAYFVAFNFERVQQFTGWRRVAARSSIVALVAASLLAHGLGAISRQGYAWNVIPDNIDDNPRRLWDWADSPFARGWPISGRAAATK
jgi:hypothetical protein